MIAVTIGIGEKYELLAELAAESCRRRTGMQTFVLGAQAMQKHQLAHPHHLKFKMFTEFPKEENILYFDADTIFLRNCSFCQFENKPDLVCVNDLADKGWVTQDARRAGVRPTEYFNSGFFIVNRTHHEKMLAKAEALLATIKSPFKDQTHLNAARAQLKIPVHWLPKEFNWLDFHLTVKPGHNIVIGHMHGMAKRTAEQIRWFYQFWQNPASDFYPRVGRGDAILKRIQTVKQPIGAEVGVLRGTLSAYLLGARPDLHLTMVDPWKQSEAGSRYEQSGSTFGFTKQGTFDQYYATALKRTAFADYRRRVIRARSLEAVPQVANGSLDFAFIDADHTYEGVIEDIRAWLPKLKPHGLLCGHDFEFKQYPKWGVKKAVDEISAELKLSYERDEDFTWFIRLRSA